MTELETVECVGCFGDGMISAFVRRAGSCNLERIQCSDCKGSGRLDKTRLEWIKAGEAMFRDRVDRDMSLREEAKRRGMTPRELGDMEHGRVQPVKADV